MTRTTRLLTGRPSWPIICLAGVEKSGKTYAAVEASASDLIGRTFLVALGEDDPDEYGLIPGQRVELVEHNGTYRDVLAAVRDASTIPADDKPNLLIFDSGTRLWDLLTQMAQDEANRRAADKARRANRPVSSEDARIAPDLWNQAAQRWEHLIDALRAHPGPAIITARLDRVMVMDAAGEPTKDKTWKVQAHKSLPFDVGAIVELREEAKPGTPAPAVLRGVRSLRFKPDPSSDTEAAFPNGLTIDALWRGLGLADDAAERTHTAPAPTDPADDARSGLLAWIQESGLDPREAAVRWDADHPGEALRDATDADGIRAMQAAWATELEAQRGAA